MARAAEDFWVASDDPPVSAAAVSWSSWSSRSASDAAGPRSASASQQPWGSSSLDSKDEACVKRPHLRMKNTFLQVDLPCEDKSPEGMLSRRTSISDPTSSRSSSLSRSESEASDAESSEDAKRRHTESLDVIIFGGSSETRLSRGSRKPTRERAWSPPSSAKHDETACTPCPFVASTAGCLNRKECKLCHVQHDAEQARRNQPCKWKRAKFKEALKKGKAQIEADPLNFDLLSVELPACALGDQGLHRRLFADLGKALAQARAQLAGSPGLQQEQAEVAAMLMRVPGPPTKPHKISL